MTFPVIIKFLNSFNMILDLNLVIYFKTIT
jgi:hypothetical protein